MICDNYILFFLHPPLPHFAGSDRLQRLDAKPDFKYKAIKNLSFNYFYVGF
jgi:hypothetical protein